MPIDVRTIAAEEFPAFHRAEAAGFGFVPLDDKQLERDRTVTEIDRCLAVFDDDRIVGTAGAYSFGMTLPGGAEVPVGAVTAVTVTATHRRRGLLRDLMTRQLDDIAGRGEPLAVLNASEAAIYGRFGYGLASLYQSWRLDTRRAGFREPVDPSLSLRLVPKDEAQPYVQPIYESWRRTRPGALTQSDGWWACVLGDIPSWRGGGKVFVVVCEPDPGGRHAGGYALYTMDNNHQSGDWKLHVRELIATDDAVAARLWRYVLDVDLVGSVTAEAVPLDDLLRWHLADFRQVQTTDLRDYLFVRVLDVEAALAARQYTTEDALVLDVVDPFRPATGGLYRVEGGPGGASCTRVGPDERADLVLDISDVGSLLLGGISARDLARAGRIAELSPGAVKRAERFFSWPVPPFCVTKF